MSGAVTRAVVVAHDQPGAFAIREVPRATPARNEALIRVAAFSLNRGEIRGALQQAPAGFRPGWDFAGTIIQAAADGSTPLAGTRVAGMCASGAWCEELAAPAGAFTVLPESVDFERAAALPVAGLTALHATRRNAEARKVLITGASGGVGVFALQLASRAGGAVTALIRNPAAQDLLRRLGARNVALDIAQAQAFAPYDLIIESVGGKTLSAALTMLAPGGSCVIVGASDTSIAAFEGARFRVGGTTVYGLVLGYELQREPPSIGLAELARLTSNSALDPVVEVRAPWHDIGLVAADLMARRFYGKAVLKVTG